MSVADRGMSPHDVEAALANFDRLSVATARRVVAYYMKRYEDGAVAGEFEEALASDPRVEEPGGSGQRVYLMGARAGHSPGS